MIILDHQRGGAILLYRQGSGGTTYGSTGAGVPVSHWHLPPAAYYLGHALRTKPTAFSRQTGVPVTRTSNGKSQSP